MVLENVCPPALLYLAFSIIQIIIDLYRGDSLQAMFKFIVMIIFTIVLNAICRAGMSIISWFIVFIPFILMTYLTTILFFVFGINPGKVSPNQKKCRETFFGCCDDGVTTKHDPSGRGCPYDPVPWNNKDEHHYYPRRRNQYSIGGCGGTQFGCCDDMTTSRSDLDGTNCPDYIKPPQPLPPSPPSPIVGGCAGTPFGCCIGSTTIAKTDPQGSNCIIGNGGVSTSPYTNSSTIVNAPLPAKPSSTTLPVF